MTAKKTLTPAQKKIASADRQRKTAEKKIVKKDPFRESLINFKNPTNGVQVDMSAIDENADGMVGTVVFYDSTDDAYLVTYTVDGMMGTYWAPMFKLEPVPAKKTISVSVPENMVDELKGWLNDRGGKVN
jgi:hypothetical protein